MKSTKIPAPPVKRQQKNMIHIVIGLVVGGGAVILVLNILAKLTFFAESTISSAIKAAKGKNLDNESAGDYSPKARASEIMTKHGLDQVLLYIFEVISKYGKSDHSAEFYEISNIVSVDLSEMIAIPGRSIIEFSFRNQRWRISAVMSPQYSVSLPDRTYNAQDLNLSADIDGANFLEVRYFRSWGVDSGGGGSFRTRELQSLLNNSRDIKSILTLNSCLRNAAKLIDQKHTKLTAQIRIAEEEQRFKL